jgi:hypothetical protein
MAFMMEFDAKNDILRVTLEGLLTGAILLDGYAAMTRYMASHPSCRSIVDTSAVSKFEVSSNAVRQMAGAPPVSPTASMRVFVAPQDSVYGMARMFQILTEKTRPNFHTARTIDEAYRLLGVESPTFVPVT